MTLKQARLAALQNLVFVHSGEDPTAVRAHRDIPTFSEAAERTIELLSPGWSSPRQPAIWRRSLEQYVFPELGRCLVTDVESSHLIELLSPLLERIPETTKRLRHRVAVIMAWVVLSGYRTDNPCDGLSRFLPTPAKRHFRALPHTEVAAAVDTVRRSGAFASTKLAFEFLVLTAARSGEVRGAHWDEVDFDQALWTVPPERIKTRVEHRVPLSDRALEVLREARERSRGHDLVFPSKRGGALSDATLSKLIRELGIQAVPHGFRASFRSWCAETAVDREVAEQCLAHAVASKSEKPYRRTDILERRRVVMECWADYLARPVDDDVTAG